MTFQNIFRSMADFRHVVSVLPCSPTNKDKKNLSSCAEKATWRWAFVAFLSLSYVEPATPATLKQWLRLQIDWHQKRCTFQFNLFLWAILGNTSAQLCHSASHATCNSANSFPLLPSTNQLLIMPFARLHNNLFCLFQKSTALHLGIRPLLMLHLSYGTRCHMTIRTSSSLAILKHFFLEKLIIYWNRYQGLVLWVF